MRLPKLSEKQEQKTTDRPKKKKSGSNQTPEYYKLPKSKKMFASSKVIRKPGPQKPVILTAEAIETPKSDAKRKRRIR